MSTHAVDMLGALAIAAIAIALTVWGFRERAREAAQEQRVAWDLHEARVRADAAEVVREAEALCREAS